MRSPRAWTVALSIVCTAAWSCTTPGASGTTAGSRAAPGSGGRTATAPGLAEIREADLRRDIFILAGDEMRGREAGTLDEMRATVWVAERAREAGLEPGGDNGTYYQWWPMRRTILAENSRVMIGDSALYMRRDVMMPAPAPASFDLPLVFVENPSAVPASAEGATQDLAGRAAAAVARSTAQVNQIAANLRNRGAAAILIVGDSAADTPEAWSAIVQARAVRGPYGIDTGQVMPPVGLGSPAAVPLLRARGSALARIRGAASRGERLSARIYIQTFTYPSANVVGKVTGTDPARRDEYVLFSAHQDHDGVRHIVAGDSIWNGADDNATASVALLAIGRAVSKHPMPRSALFVWHGAEERGLLGSRWFVRTPTVPRSSIVAVLNADMIGRNHPDSAALVGTRPPYRNSRALAQAGLDANAELTRFKLDTLWDLPNHCEGWYFRSDHLPYAQAGIPALFFSTLLHNDYHTPRDEPSRIDVPKLTKMTQWMYVTAWKVANARERPDVDPGFNPVRPNRSNCIPWVRGGE